MKHSFPFFRLSCYGLLFILLAVKVQAAFWHPSWWNKTVFYEIFVRSFADSQIGPLANDGIGDFQGLIDHLDYLNDGDPESDLDLGIGGIWLTPINASPSYHGYDVTDYYTCNPEYGTNEDFKRLVAEAHKRGIKIIIDLVLNHTSSEHPWFKEALASPTSPKHDWYVWAGSDQRPASVGGEGQNVWYPYHDDWYYAYFIKEMPDLNYRNSEVTKEMQRIVSFWVNDMGVDGFRLDAVDKLIEDGSITVDAQATHAWLAEFHTFYKSLSTNLFIVAEVPVQDSDTIAFYATKETDSAFEFALAADLVAPISFGMADLIKKRLDSIRSNYRNNNFAPFLSNHDQNRILYTLEGNINKAKVAATVYLTLGGTPFIYYGEEIGMSGMKPDPQLRTPMQWNDSSYGGFSIVPPWEPVNTDYSEVNVATEESNALSLLNHYKQLIRIRNQLPALQYGKFALMDSKPFGKLYALRRYLKNSEAVVLINFTDKPITSIHLASKRTNIRDNWHAQNSVTEQSIPLPTMDDAGTYENWQPIKELPPYGFAILSLSSE